MNASTIRAGATLDGLAVVRATFGPTPAELETERRLRDREHALVLPALEDLDSSLHFKPESRGRGHDTRE